MPVIKEYKYQSTNDPSVVVSSWEEVCTLKEANPSDVRYTSWTETISPILVTLLDV